MIRIQCDNCGEQVNPADAVGIGLPMDNRDFRYDAENEMVVVVSVSKNGTSNQFCKACMWKAIAEMVDRMSPAESAWQVFAREYIKGVGEEARQEDLAAWTAREAGDDGPGIDTPDSDVYTVRVEQPVQESGPDAVAKLIEQVRRENLVRRGGGSPWPFRGSKGSTLYRAGRALLTSGTKGRKT